MLLVESPESESELEAIGQRLDKPLVVNLVEGGRTPILPDQKLAQLGFVLAIHPATPFLAAAESLRRTYEHLKQTGGSAGLEIQLFEFSKFSRMMGFDLVRDFEARNAQ
jgi:2-methylisocitrate lyase-like PEP mutase family enzyme